MSTRTGIWNVRGDRIPSAAPGGQKQLRKLRPSQWGGRTTGHKSRRNRTFLILQFIQQLLFSEAFDSKSVNTKGKIPIDFWEEFLGSDQGWGKMYENSNHS